MKNKSFIGKVVLSIIGFGLCVLKWTNVLPSADIKEIWYSVAFAYGVGFGTIDFNICRDNWVEGKVTMKQDEADTTPESEEK